jgi:hypothetical protein
MAQRLMSSFFVVFFQSLLSLLSDFVQTLKHKHVEHRFTVAAIKSFDEAVLHQPARLDELKQHVVFFGPIGQRHSMGEIRKRAFIPTICIWTRS